MADLLIGCSGWSYSDLSEEGGWVGPFYPNKSTKPLPYYSQYFRTAEFNAIYYEKFYEHMGAKTFEGMINATPKNFEFSIKVPETITRKEKLGTDATPLFEEYLRRIEPLEKAGKLGAILFQMSPNFTVEDFRNAEQFIDKLPREYDYALEFRHESWQTEGAPELLQHYNIASVITDSPDPKLQYLSEPIVTADHAFIRLHGRNEGFWYNYLYSKDELGPWVDKVSEIKNKAKTIRVYFNNHPGGKAVLNALQFKELMGELTEKEKEALAKAEEYLTGKKTTKTGLDQWVG
ncbi:MAG TPA: DUF72 domain-containing protein [Nitrososphaera sp.]|nr:DUF72 domain-containing protein [Nitrososphaera sp.]